VYCGKTIDWIWIPFGLVSGVGQEMGVLDGGGDRRKGRAILGVNVWHPIVTNGILCMRGGQITLGFLVINNLTNSNNNDNDVWTGQDCPACNEMGGGRVEFMQPSTTTTVAN